MLKNNKGITLTVLVITVVVMCVLAGITIVYSQEENGVLNTLKEKEFKTYITFYYEDLDVYIKKQKLKSGYNIENINAGNINNLTLDGSTITFSTQIESIIPDILDEHKLKFVIHNGILYYVQTEVNDQTEREVVWCRENKILRWENT